MHDNDPDLDDLLSDPLVRLVMASDGVEEAQIRTLAQRIALRQTTRDIRTRGRSDEESTLWHTPSCRAGWRWPSSVRPSV